MAESTQLGTLKLPETTPFCFPRHRRRPIRSNTYFKLIQLLSNCPTGSPQFNDGDDDDVELRPESAEDVPVSYDQLKSEELLIPKDILVKGTSIDNSKENVSFQGGGVDGDQIAVSELDGVNLVTDGQLQITQNNIINVDGFLIDQNPSAEYAIQLVDELEDLDSILKFHTVDSGPAEQMKVDNEFSIDDFCEVLDSCYGRDAILEPSKLGEDAKENNLSLEVNKSEEFKHQVQLEEMELEKLVSTLGTVGPSCPTTVDEEMEEGEICGEPGVSDETMFTLPENTILSGVKSSGVIHASEDNVDKKESICNIEQRGFLRQETCGHSLIGIPDDYNHCMKMELRESSRQMRDVQPQSVYRNGHLETRVRDPATETLPQSGRSPLENATEEPISAVNEKDCDGSTKKRKKGPLTKEKKVRKKLKSRIKRAEKNRKLGIKRLKIQPILKPKKITYCRHYLQGRCHEGEKCKFSHDTTPLTKSKPCGHFARHSCMKGDDCPFDHQLSKYPCNNYTTTGFCSRGADCLFSHKMPEKQLMPTTSSILNPDLKPEQLMMSEKEGALLKLDKAEVVFPARLYSSNSSKPVDILTSHQKLDAKFSHIRDSSGKSITRDVAKPFARTVGQAPKGVSFLSDPNMSLHNSKLEQDGVFQKAGDGVNIGRETIQKVSCTSTEVNEGVTVRKPRGINFLSFLQPSVDNSSSKMFSNLFSNSYEETGKTVMTDFAEEKQACSLPKSDNSSLVNFQKSQTATSLAPNSDLEGKDTPMPQLTMHKSSLTQHKIQADDSVFKGDIFLSRVGEKTTAPGKLPLKTPQLIVDGSWDQPSSAEADRNATRFFKASLLSNAPNLVQRAVQSALAIAAKFEPEIKLSSSFTNGAA